MAIKKNQVLVPDHVYVPKHEIIPMSDAEEVLKEAGIASTVQALSGDTLSLLTQYQKVNNIDITMMGTFSHSKLHGFIFGSFTTRMLLESETQFLLVR